MSEINNSAIVLFPLEESRIPATSSRVVRLSASSIIFTEASSVNPLVLSQPLNKAFNADVVALLSPLPVKGKMVETDV